MPRLAEQLRTLTNTEVKLRGYIRSHPWSVTGILSATLGGKQWTVQGSGYGVFNTSDVQSIVHYPDSTVVNILES